MLFFIYIYLIYYIHNILCIPFYSLPAFHFDPLLYEHVIIRPSSLPGFTDAISLVGNIITNVDHDVKTVVKVCQMCGGSFNRS